MNDLHASLLTLVRDTKGWLLSSDMEIPAPSIQASPPLVVKKPQNPFALSPMTETENTPFHEMRELVNKCTPTLAYTEPTFPIWIIHDERSAEDMTFLQNLVKAMGQLGLIATLRYQEQMETTLWEHLNSASEPNLVLAPLGLLTPHMPTLAIHSAQSINAHLTLLPLASIESYHQNQSLKRTLWNTLKTKSSTQSPQ